MTTSASLARWRAGFAALAATNFFSLGCSVTVGEAALFPPRAEPLPPMNEFVRENVSLFTQDGVRLRGWRLRNSASVRTVVFFYGNQSSVIASAWALDWLARALEADVVAFDYRGYGFSEGEASVDQFVLHDAAEVYRFAAKGKPVVAVGQSMGTASAIHLAATSELESLLLLAPLASLEDALAGLRARVPWYTTVNADPSLASLRTDPLKDIRQVSEPTLVISGESDLLASPDAVERLSRVSAAQRLERCTVEGAHGDIRLENAAVRGCVEQFYHVVEKAPGAWRSSL